MECPFKKIFPSKLLVSDEYYMAFAYNEAILAWQGGEVPIGAVAVANGEIIASCHNSVATLNDPTAHAEILAITQSARAVGDWRLNDVTLYVTKEPCPMCAGATIMSRVGRVVYAVPDGKMGCLGGSFCMQNLSGINHRPQVTAGVLRDQCLKLLQSFFELKRLPGEEMG
ncbi:MAG: tRNA adenosine(34) deaminase TadA [Puniceicoccales bacterium]|nr:tRNA adenosine(34) deaminase TadA [Puniceicoccales bacterium]